MYDSFTSTSISLEFMSTTVAIPVRVKPPPAEIGETISPTCASLETTMPSNGARIVQLSTACCASRVRASAAIVCALARSILACKRSEEHTSELQSLAYLVCRLLLEKKNYAC